MPTLEELKQYIEKEYIPTLHTNYNKPVYIALSFSKGIYPPISRLKLVLDTYICNELSKSEGINLNPKSQWRLEIVEYNNFVNVILKFGEINNDYLAKVYCNKCRYSKIVAWENRHNKEICGSCRGTLKYTGVRL